LLVFLKTEKVVEAIERRSVDRLGEDLLVGLPAERVADLALALLALDSPWPS
jgi:hypothetical protein